MKRISLVLSATLAVGSTLIGQELIVDQEYAPGGITASVSPFVGLGQEFTPRLDSMDFVNVSLFNLNPGGPSTFQVSIHEGSITGPTVGTSPVTLGSTDLWTEFTFASTLSLTPNNIYVIQVEQLSGDSGWGLLHNFPANGTYDFGTAIVGGTPQSFDFRFQEGVIAVPEPSLLLLTFVSTIVAGLIIKIRNPPA